MRTMLPRLRNLLTMLAAESEPLPVKEVADRLRVSKRTVFRELAGIGSVLDGYDLEVGSRPGEGIVLAGAAQAKSALLSDLDKLGSADPADKRDRRDRLFLELLRRPGQKLAAYADRFKVSVPTVSHDLDDIESWLAERGLALSRKQGLGIFIAGDEMAVRRAALAVGRRTREPGAYPHPDIRLDLSDLAPELDAFLDWMTPQSREALSAYLSVAVQRVMDGCALRSVPDRREEFSAEALRLAGILSEAFNCSFSPPELAALELELASCRPKLPRSGRDDARNGGSGDDASLASVAGDMVGLFDPEQAALLRMDELLMEGLLNHLRSAAVRIRHGIELDDPMLEQMTRNYPDIMQRSRRACEALRRFGDRLPESEVSLFAAHFAAARLRLSDQDARQRTVRVGIICVHGIGSSYLLASQVKRVFGARTAVEVAWHGDRETWRQFDVLVSVTALPDVETPVVVVPPILGDGDIRRVEDALSRVRGAPRAPEKQRDAFADDLRLMENLSAAARHVLEHFTLAPTPGATSLAELPLLAGRLFGKTREAAAAVAWALTAREAVATQRIPELGIVLLHCRTEGVDGPLFGVIRPDGGKFLWPVPEAVRSCLVMLLPADAPRGQTELMGRISTALVERESFMDAVRTGGADAVRKGLEQILGEFLFQFAVQKLKG